MASTYARALGRAPSTDTRPGTSAPPVWDGLSADLDAFLTARPAPQTIAPRQATWFRGLAEVRRQAGYEERLRIAQEVHDVVGHGLAVISVNAGAALMISATSEPLDISTTCGAPPFTSAST